MTLLFLVVPSVTPKITVHGHFTNTTLTVTVNNNNNNNEQTVFRRAPPSKAQRKTKLKIEEAALKIVSLTDDGSITQPVKVMN